ncbi:E3 ubiquitin-protein ligase RNF144 [Paragonimus westermani]|uniref:E3 ubiquitin-protein ligase RNF144 n=1 Tax=Paragonimus westermani TaxID=34504 RepID=A0A5J4P3B2_9TREM|nr:E3 ubiquitin-protein ligase RNF144 [Paragonimus westermani]
MHYDDDADHLSIMIAYPGPSHLDCFRWFYPHPHVIRCATAGNSVCWTFVEVSMAHRRKTTNNLRIKPLIACPSVGVTCPACQYTFCARCHIAWHPNQPFLCQSGLDHEARRRLNTYGVIRESRATKLQDQSNAIQSHRPSDLETSEQASGQSFSQGGSSSLHKLSKLQKYDRFRRLKSRMTLSPAHVTNSSSTVVDISALAVGFPPYPTEAWLKRCPACFIPIERIEGCAQMMCRSCKHTFCWYCLKSLDYKISPSADVIAFEQCIMQKTLVDFANGFLQKPSVFQVLPIINLSVFQDDFLLHHYDFGACKGKLGHSRASILGHRVYVVSVFTGLTLLLLIAAPFVLISLPCIVCAKCHDIHRQRRLRKCHARVQFLSNGFTIRDPSESANSSQCTSAPLTFISDGLVGEPLPEPVQSAIDSNLVVAQTADVHWFSHRSGDSET